MKLTKEAELAAEWDLSHEQFRVLRRRNKWAHVRFSRQDIRYTAEQVEQIVHVMTTRDAAEKRIDNGLTSRSAARAS